MSVPHFKRAPPFDPTQIAGCATWLDSSDITTMFQNTSATTPVTADGQTIGAWKDKSINSYLFIQGTTANQPTYKSSILNGSSITRWNGSSTGLQSSTTLPFYTSASSGGSFFFVFMITNNSSQRFLMTYQNQTSGTFCVSESEIGCPTGNVDTGNFGIHQGCSKANVALNQTTTNTYLLMNLNLLSSGVAPANTTIFKNGTLSSMTAQNGGFYSGTTYPYTNNARYLNIGYRVPNGGTTDCWLAGDIAELIWFQNPLTTPQQQKVEGYLAQKWGLRSNMPPGHPAITSTIYPTQRIARALPVSYSTAFSPKTNISGCQLWMDATDSTTITRSGANITQWNDKANLYTGTATNNPQYNSSPINGLPTIHFDGSSGRYVLITANNYNYSYMTYFMVIRWLSGTGGFMGTDTPGNYGRALEVSSPYVYMLLYSQFYTTTVQLTAGQPCILSAYFNSTTDFTVILNGVKTLFSVSQGAGNTNTNGFNIGVSNPTNTGSHSFDMGEGIVYNSILSDSQRQQVESYLAQKWGLTSNLPAGHLNLTFPAGTPSFTQNVFGQIQRSVISLSLAPVSTYTPLSAFPLLWLDASVSSSFTFASANNISIWADRSGNGNNATQATAGLQPTYTTNTVNLNGSQWFAVNLDFIAGHDFSAFVVLNNTNYVNIYGALTAGNGSSSLHNGFANSSTYRVNYWGNDYGPSISAAYHAGSTNLINIDWVNTGNVGKSVRANGNLEGSAGQTGGISAMSGGGTIGNVVGQGILSGTIYEIIFILDTNITTTNRNKLEGYLAWKWGIQSYLPSGHPYLSGPPTS